MTGSDDHSVYVRAVQKALGERMGHSVSLKSLPKEAMDLICSHLSKKGNITNRLIHNIALELSILYKKELKKPPSKEFEYKTRAEMQKELEHKILGFLIVCAVGWFLLLNLWIVANLILEVITAPFN